MWSELGRDERHRPRLISHSGPRQVQLLRSGVAKRTSNFGSAQGGGASLASLMASFEPGLRTTAATTPLPRPRTSTAAPTSPSGRPCTDSPRGPRPRTCPLNSGAMSLDRVHRGREPLPAGAAGDGVAVVVFRFVLGREAPRQRGVVLFLAPSVAVAAPRSCSSRRRRRRRRSLTTGSATAAGLASAALVFGAACAIIVVLFSMPSLSGIAARVSEHFGQPCGHLARTLPLSNGTDKICEYL